MKELKKKMKKSIIILIILLFFNTGISEAKTQKIKIHVSEETKTNIKYEGITLNNNKLTIKTNINGHKVRLKTPAISKNKYLKLVNVVM